MRQDSSQIIRSWKDARFRETQQVAFEPNPAGVVELDDALLADVSGTSSTDALLTLGCCFAWAPFKTHAVGTYGCCVHEE